jgi:cell division protein FtsB
MATLRQRRDPVRIFMRRLALLGLFILVIVAASGVWSIYRKDQESIVLKEQAQAQLADLSTQQAQLNASIAELQTERGKEAALRQQYSVGDPGEGMIMIVEPAAATPIATTTTPFQAWLHSAFSWW